MNELKLQALPPPRLGGLKRKPADEPPLPLPSDDKKRKADRWSFFGEKEVEKMTLCFDGILSKSKESGVCVENHTAFFVLQLRRLGGLVTLAELKQQLLVFHQIYDVRGVAIHLKEKTIDVRFQIPVNPKNTQLRAFFELANVVRTGFRRVPEKFQKQFNAGELTVMPGTALDAAMISCLTWQGETLLGEETPFDMAYWVTEPSGRRFNTEGKEHKTEAIPKERPNYLFEAIGYTKIDLLQLESFQDILPFHAHSVAIDFDRQSVQVQVQPYLEPKLGLVRPLFGDANAPLTFV